MCSKFQGNKAGEERRRVQLADDALQVGQHTDKGMNRRDIAKAGRRERHKAEIEDRAIGLPPCNRWDIGQGSWNEIPD